MNPMGRRARTQFDPPGAKPVRGEEFKQRGALRTALIARGLEKVSTRTAERLAIYKVESEKHDTGLYETDPKQAWVPSWAVGLLLAEPTLPDTREAAFKVALENEETRRAIEAAYKLGKREAVAELINEMFPTEGW